MKQETAKSIQRRGRALCVTSNFPRWFGGSTTPFVLHLAQDLWELGLEIFVLGARAAEVTAAEEVVAEVRVERFHCF